MTYDFALTRLTPAFAIDEKDECVLTYPEITPCLDQCRGNPVLPGMQEKRQTETDFTAAAGGLAFTRIYQSRSGQFYSPLNQFLSGALPQPVPQRLCGYYNDPWGKKYACVGFTGSDSTDVTVHTDDGRLIVFSGPATATTARADVNDRLTQRTNAAGAIELVVQRADNSTEVYNSGGQLVQKNQLGGRDAITYRYSDATTPATTAPRADLLIDMADRFGRHLVFTYNANSQLATMTDPAGKAYTYSYDIDGNLVSVTYPDGKVRSYQYGEAAYVNNGVDCGAPLPNALTGITDENGMRFAIFTYECNGRAASTEHVGGVEKYSFMQYGYGTNEIDPLGTPRYYEYSDLVGVRRLTGTTQPGPGGVGTVTNALTYDTNGNVASRTDFNGITTAYTYDTTRNLETFRVEAIGTSAARTITTSWHASYRLPLKIAEPKLLTTLTYDASGNLLSRKQQATTDATGALGLAAPVTGTARTWSWTYNGIGQVLTATGPRTDVVDRTTYVYDSASGNLTSSTNAAGQVTTFNSYDANGRLTRMTDPNGAVTTLTYAPRGWLLSSTTQAGAISEATRYTYDAVGQLTGVTLPDASVVHYGYDDAHRLTSITDNLGNRIAYTLDNIGNRINETVSDPGGVLARQTSRSYDALNRLQQVTGGVQ
ncbi:RHS repeat protein [Actimicrobium sp. GrIS 1.19]|uniref:RHS repeat protein n=1 Tax=Actimicrobium sp. GrIS 1.19 TaxID=3071708 RepID=UPI002E0EFA3B